MKTQSDRLRKTATDFGGGRGTNNKKARLLEKNLYTTVRDKLLPQLEKDFPNCVFVLQRDLKKTAANIRKLPTFTNIILQALGSDNKSNTQKLD